MAKIMRNTAGEPHVILAANDRAASKMVSLSPWMAARGGGVALRSATQSRLGVLRVKKDFRGSLIDQKGQPMTSVPLDWSRMRNIQKFHRALYTIGLGPLIGRIVLLLTTTGRKSGLPRVTPLSYEEINGDYYLGSARGINADWVRNIQSNPNVELRVGAKRLRGVAEVISDPLQMADFMEVRLERHPRLIGLIMEKAHGLPRRPSREQLEGLAKRSALVSVHPTG